MKIEIKSRWSDSILFAHEAEGNSLKITLAMALKAGVDLSGANLGGTYLGGAYLRGANLGEGGKMVGERPFFQIGPIGSRNDYLLAFITDKGLLIRAGCFFGFRGEFALKIDEEYGGGIHGDEYRAALALIDKHAELWMPPTEEMAAA